MKLSNAEIRPGKVIKVIDEYGAIKASCCGLFDENDDPEMLPPVIPMFKLSPTGFTKPHEGDEIWVWFFKDNPQELFYMFQGDVKTYNGKFLEAGHKDIEILAKHNIDEENVAQQYFSDSDGWILQYGDTKIQLDTNSDIILSKNGNTRTIKVSDDGISLGGDYNEPAVLGDKMVESLQKIYNVLDGAAKAAMGNPYTTQVGIAIQNLLPAFKQSIEPIKSKNIFIDR